MGSSWPTQELASPRWSRRNQKSHRTRNRQAQASLKPILRSDIDVIRSHPSGLEAGTKQSQERLGMGITAGGTFRSAAAQVPTR